MESKITWISDMAFESENRGLTSVMDTSPEYGGKNSGPSPKEAVLNAMCVCSGMDVVTIARKMRLELTSFQMHAHAEKTKTVPSFFASVHINYVIAGSGDPQKFINSVTLSMTKYCGVSYMISKVCPITYEIHLNGQSIFKDIAKFEIQEMV
jgi:putative redox protein